MKRLVQFGLLVALSLGFTVGGAAHAGKIVGNGQKHIRP